MTKQGYALEKIRVRDEKGRIKTSIVQAKKAESKRLGIKRAGKENRECLLT